MPSTRSSSSTANTQRDTLPRSEHPCDRCGTFSGSSYRQLANHKRTCRVPETIESATPQALDEDVQMEDASSMNGDDNISNSGK